MYEPRRIRHRAIALLAVTLVAVTAIVAVQASAARPAHLLKH
jgi:hypothetical protein